MSLRFEKQQAPTEEYKGIKAKASHTLFKTISKSVEKDSNIMWNFTKFQNILYFCKTRNDMSDPTLR